MSTDTTPGFGLDGTVGWAVGGIVGGVVAAGVFGLLAWLFDPAVVEASIPAIYGFDESTALGLGIHGLHGAVLGLLFGAVITRPIVLEALGWNAETDAISATDLGARVVGAGFVFGLAVWAILPLLVLPTWIEAVGAEAAADIPSQAFAGLVGHLVFGSVLGLVFAATVDLRARAPRT